MSDEMSKKTGQLNVRVAPEDVAILEEIEAKHGYTQTIIIRQLVQAVGEFYRKNGYFAFPVKLLPEKEFLAAVLKASEAAELQEMAEKLPKPKPRKAS